MKEEGTTSYNTYKVKTENHPEKGLKPYPVRISALFYFYLNIVFLSIMLINIYQTHLSSGHLGLSVHEFGLNGILSIFF